MKKRIFLLIAVLFVTASLFLNVFQFFENMNIKNTPQQFSENSPALKVCEGEFVSDTESLDKTIQVEKGFIANVIFQDEEIIMVENTGLWVSFFQKESVKIKDCWYGDRYE